MFGRRDSRSDTPSGRERFATILGEHTTIRGDLELADGIRIDGRLQGNASAAADARVTVVVGAKGQVCGDISATRVVVAGMVQGCIHAEEEIELQASAQVHGDVQCKHLRVQQGARLVGRVAASEQAAAGGKPVLVVDHQESPPKMQRQA